VKSQPRADLEQQLEECRLELAEAREHLAEALEQQSATSEVLTVTSEVLQVISSSHGEPIFQKMLISATRICDGQIWNFIRVCKRPVSSDFLAGCASRICRLVSEPCRTPPGGPFI
jgi:hypothetical protein